MAHLERSTSVDGRADAGGATCAPTGGMPSAIAPPLFEAPEDLLPSIHEAEVALEHTSHVRRARSLLALTTFGALEAAAGIVGARVTKKKKNMAWYRLLAKPRTTPPDWAFGVVWTGLYALSAVSAWRVWRSPKGPARTGALAAWGAQLASTTAWSPLFFGAKRPKLALADLVVLGASLGAFTFVARKVDRGAAALALPYLAWVGFAGTINGSVVRKNALGVRRLLVRG